MKNILTLLACLFLINLSFSQSNVELTINSESLGEDRIVDIHIPESYSSNDENYPVIYCLDGEYAQLIVNGSIEYYAYFKKVPECIIVSIRQNYFNADTTAYKRWEDCSYTWTTGLLNEKGENFKNFIDKELIPAIDKEYRTSSFRTIIGHSFTANFVNYYLLDDSPLFNAYISISPYYTLNMFEVLKSKIENLSEPVYYFTTYGEKDLTGHQKSVKNFDKEFSKIENKNFNYYLYDLKGNEATHFTIYPKSLPSAIEFVFSSYAPISENEYKEVLPLNDKVSYLNHRYATIEKLYGTEMKVREDDFISVATAAHKKKQWSELKLLGEWCITEYPDQSTGYSFIGIYEEKMKNYEKALEFYQLGYDLLSDDILNKADYSKDINRMKKKLKMN